MKQVHFDVGLHPIPRNNLLENLQCQRAFVLQQQRGVDFGEALRTRSAEHVGGCLPYRANRGKRAKQQVNTDRKRAKFLHAVNQLAQPGGHLGRVFGKRPENQSEIGDVRAIAVRRIQAVEEVLSAENAGQRNHRIPIFRTSQGDCGRRDPVRVAGLAHDFYVPLDFIGRQGFRHWFPS